MNRFLTNATRVFMVPIVLAACSARTPIQGTPSPAAVAEFLGVAASDPEILRLLALAGQPQPPGVPFICLSTQTRALFDLEAMSTDTRKATQLYERLKSSFRAVTLDFPWGMYSSDPRRPPLRVKQADACTPGEGTPRLWVAVSPSISNPFADRHCRTGFFADVHVESDRGLIVERYSYWIGAKENPASGQHVVAQVLRIASGLDNIVVERTQLLP